VVSQSNVEIAKRALDAFNLRDVEALLNMGTPDWVLSSQLLDASADFREREGIERFYAMLSESWEEFRTVVDDYRDLGDRVLCLGRNTARGKGSGATVDAPTAAILDFRDGEISRIRLYLDQGEALRAARLSE
jgi:ketosteroid isomerase-like protein